MIIGSGAVPSEPCSNTRDHAKSDQHLHAMSLLQREHVASNGPSSSTSAAPIVVALTTLPDERARLRKKVDGLFHSKGEVVIP